jgi:adenylosuccinate lyase
MWVALAAAQHAAGLVTAEQLADLEAHADNVDIERALEIEIETRHDVMAEIRAFAEQCPTGGGIIHWGATSADITDNVDVLRQREAARLIANALKELLNHFAERIEATADLPTMAVTHIQPAEPTTVGYRLAVYAQDLLEDYQQLEALIASLRGKGLKGAVGTQASYAEMLRETAVSPAEMEAQAMTRLKLPYFPIATQTYSRQQDLRVLQVLAGTGASLHKFALDFRILQSPFLGEWTEPFGREQVGSSAMPFKRNPIHCENICSLARYVASMTAVAWDNASQAVLERSLDDSANRRSMLAEAFLATEEIVRRATTVVAEMEINEEPIGRNLARYGPFAATERLLMALVAAGANRQDAHEWIRAASLRAWRALQQGEENPLVGLILEDEGIRRYLSAGQIQHWMDAREYTGNAAVRARSFVEALHKALTALHD